VKGHRINLNRCTGCGLCYGAIPVLFRRMDDGRAAPIDGPIEDHTGQLMAVIEDCPGNAIKLRNVGRDA
jgi:ferredoxin